jgi:Nup133 N terminal like
LFGGRRRANPTAANNHHGGIGGSTHLLLVAVATAVFVVVAIVMTSLPHTPAPTAANGVAAATTNGGSASAALYRPQTVKANLQQFWRDDYAPLQLAGEQVLLCLREDETSPDADLYRRIATSSSSVAVSATSTSATTTGDVGSFSGYRLASSASSASSSADGNGRNGAAGTALASPPTTTLVSPRLVHVKSIPLPAALRDALQAAQNHTFLGLLAPAQLGWLSVDDTLALWKLPSPSSPLSSGSMFLPSSSSQAQQHQSNGGDDPNVGAAPICQFRVPSGQPIVTVGLVRPKPGASRKLTAFVVHSLVSFFR